MKADTVLRCCIYALHDPVTDLIGYVGQSIHPYKRLYEHYRLIHDYIEEGLYNEEGYHRTTQNEREITHKKDSWLMHLMAKKQMPKVVILEELDKESYYAGLAYAAEEKWINFMIYEGEPLTNAAVVYKQRSVGDCPYEHEVAHLRNIKRRIDYRPVIEAHWGSMNAWVKSAAGVITLIRDEARAKGEAI